MKSASVSWEDVFLILTSPNFESHHQKNGQCFDKYRIPHAKLCVQFGGNNKEDNMVLVLMGLAAVEIHRQIHS